MNRLLKLYADNRALRPAARRYEVLAQADDAVTVYLYDVIVSSALEAEYWGGVAAEQFVRDFVAIDAATIHLRINSPGGDVFAARAMEQAIVNSKANVIAHIDGYAASAASFVALAADEVEISEGGFIMVHKSWALAMGNADDLRELAGVLDQIDATLVASYQKRTGMKAEDVMQLLADETWIGAQEAVDLKFADRVAAAPDAKDRVDWNVSALTRSPADRARDLQREEQLRRLNHYQSVAS